ncbi:hypothetical protein BH24ACT19_BH24ACT19_09560 [soil metagenome]
MDKRQRLRSAIGARNVSKGFSQKADNQKTKIRAGMFCRPH